LISYSKDNSFVGMSVSFRISPAPCSRTKVDNTKTKFDQTVNFAVSSGRSYAPATEDLLFEFAAGSDGGTLSTAFVQATTALSFK
jgi:hypothetical protein